MEINVNLLKDNIHNVLRITTRDQIFYGKVISYNAYPDNPNLVKDISIVNDQILLYARISSKNISRIDVKEQASNEIPPDNLNRFLSSEQ